MPELSRRLSLFDRSDPNRLQPPISGRLRPLRENSQLDLGGGYGDYPYGVALTEMGEIIVVGQAQTSTGYDLAVAVLDDTGAPETSFSSDGLAYYEYEDLASGLT